jgi:hypothetical protein
MDAILSNKTDIEVERGWYLLFVLNEMNRVGIKG